MPQTTTVYDQVQIKRYRVEINSKIQSKEWSYLDVLELHENIDDVNYNFVLNKAKSWCRKQLEQITLDKFDEEKWENIYQRPDDFKLLKRVPFSEDPSKYPYELQASVGDEVCVVFLDVETTGLSHQTDKLIELGLVKIKYSPSLKIITSIDLVRSEYQDPGIPIPEIIKDLTGISNDDTDGKCINVNEVRLWLETEDTYVIAHNAKFDRPFFNQLIPSENYTWGCSANQIDWPKYGDYRIESKKLEYILLKLGYFYEGHRASIDCLAMVQMFISIPEALKDLIDNINKNSYRIEAINAPYSIKDMLKGAGYRWDGEQKHWWTEATEDELEKKLNELDSFSTNYSKESSKQIEFNAKDRFKL